MNPRAHILVTHSNNFSMGFKDSSNSVFIIPWWLGGHSDSNKESFRNDRMVKWRFKDVKSAEISIKINSLIKKTPF